jgi:nucleoside-diphosphate-sugar epimerase
MATNYGFANRQAGKGPGFGSIASTDHLDDLLSTPTPGVIETLSKLDGDILILGVGGKMGPTLARMAARALQEAGIKRRVIGVARFSNQDTPAWLQKHGVEPLTADLLDPQQFNRLPDAANVIAMTALKFGSTDRPGDTWAVNCWMSANICQRFAGSRIAAFSTGNVYPLTPIGCGGCLESDPLAPVGEYAASCLGRERLYDYFSRTAGTRVSILRLNYACELRYGVLVDLARQILAGEPIDLTMGAVNVIWQGDANAMTLQALAHAASPPFVVNIAGPELSVRRICEQLGELLGRPPVFAGTEGPDALLSNGQLGTRLYGDPQVPTDQLCQWIADWLLRGGELLGKPTKFQVRDGRF